MMPRRVHHPPLLGNRAGEPIVHRLSIAGGQVYAQAAGQTVHEVTQANNQNDRQDLGLFQPHFPQLLQIVSGKGVRLPGYLDRKVQHPAVHRG